MTVYYLASEQQLENLLELEGAPRYLAKCLSKAIASSLPEVESTILDVERLAVAQIKTKLEANVQSKISSKIWNTKRHSRGPRHHGVTWEEIESVFPRIDEQTKSSMSEKSSDPKTALDRHVRDLLREELKQIWRSIDDPFVLTQDMRFG